MPPVRILVDNAVADAERCLAPLGELTCLDAADIRPESLAAADALIVRSGVRIDAALLADSRVRFVGTATSGVDHVDVHALARANIRFAAAPGCNARPVAEYVVAVLLDFAERSAAADAAGVGLARRTLGIVGLGHVGSIVAAFARALGLNVLTCDPPLARRGSGLGFVDLHRLLAESDIVTLHVPLLHAGPDATHRLVDSAALARMRPGALLINTARGGVLHTPDALNALRRRSLGGLVVDVWSGEPAVDRDLLAAATIMTPHIAGYSRDALQRGTRMVAAALAEFLGRAPTDPRTPAIDPPPIDVDLAGLDDAEALRRCVRAVCDPRRDAAEFRAAVARDTADGRDAYRARRIATAGRREFRAVRAVNPCREWLRRALRNLGFSIAE
ncbi:MAG: 4-phosphoerythronate dehydrogenase [Phycisphaerae bacterium]|nr:4-phosphoerythronate dehydrogenase [Phycisphaerae bacterium]